jgi:hypothetical protein
MRGTTACWHKTPDGRPLRVVVLVVLIVVGLVVPVPVALVAVGGLLLVVVVHAMGVIHRLVLVVVGGLDVVLLLDDCKCANDVRGCSGRRSGLGGRRRGRTRSRDGCGSSARHGPWGRRWRRAWLGGLGRLGGDSRGS